MYDTLKSESLGNEESSSALFTMALRKNDYYVARRAIVNWVNAVEAKPQSSTRLSNWADSGGLAGPIKTTTILLLKFWQGGVFDYETIINHPKNISTGINMMIMSNVLHLGVDCHLYPGPKFPVPTF